MVTHLDPATGTCYCRLRIEVGQWREAAECLRMVSSLTYRSLLQWSYRELRLLLEVIQIQLFEKLTIALFDFISPRTTSKTYFMSATVVVHRVGRNGVRGGVADLNQSESPRGTSSAVPSSWELESNTCQPHSYCTGCVSVM